jgi:hypothetical protein
MARWRETPVRFEAPAWYRSYDPAMWDEPDAQEQSMIDGSLRPPGEWPDWLHEIHAHRRWVMAQYEYGRKHPAFAAQEFEDLMNRHWERHG